MSKMESIEKITQVNIFTADLDRLKKLAGIFSVEETLTRIIDRFIEGNAQYENTVRHPARPVDMMTEQKMIPSEAPLSAPAVAAPVGMKKSGAGQTAPAPVPKTAVEPDRPTEPLVYRDGMDIKHVRFAAVEISNVLMNINTFTKIVDHLIGVMIGNGFGVEEISRISGLQVRHISKAQDFNKKLPDLGIAYRRETSAKMFLAVRKIAVQLKTPLRITFRWPDEKSVPHKIRGKNAVFEYTHVRSGPKVTVGSTVELKWIGARNSGKVAVYTIQEGPNDPAHGIISSKSPIAAAIIGSVEGDLCSYDVGGKKSKVRIVEVA